MLSIEEDDGGGEGGGGDGEVGGGVGDVAVCAAGAAQTCLEAGGGDWLGDSGVGGGERGVEEGAEGSSCWCCGGKGRIGVDLSARRQMASALTGVPNGLNNEMPFLPDVTPLCAVCSLLRDCCFPTSV